jgi:hypothetical protein
MTTIRPHDDPVVAALSLTLDRYPWRSFTPRLVARLVLAQWDRHAVERLLTDLPGTSPGVWRPVEPAPADDPRAQALVAFLTSRSWKHLSASTVARLLLGLLDDVPR